MPDVTAYLSSFSHMVTLGTTLVEDARKVDITVFCNCLQCDHTLSVTTDTVPADIMMANYLSWITILNSNYVAFSSFLKDLASTETDICQGYQRRFAEYYYNFCLQDEHLKANSMSLAFEEKRETVFSHAQKLCLHIHALLCSLKHLGNANGLLIGRLAFLQEDVVENKIGFITYYNHALTDATIITNSDIQDCSRSLQWLGSKAFHSYRDAHRLVSVETYLLKQVWDEMVPELLLLCEDTTHLEEEYKHALDINTFPPLRVEQTEATEQYLQMFVFSVASISIRLEDVNIPSIRRKVVDTIYVAIDMISSILGTSRTKYNQVRQLQSLRSSWQGEVDVLTHNRSNVLQMRSFAISSRLLC